MGYQIKTASKSHDMQPLVNVPAAKKRSVMFREEAEVVVFHVCKTATEVQAGAKNATKVPTKSDRAINLKTMHNIGHMRTSEKLENLSIRVNSPTLLDRLTSLIGSVSNRILSFCKSLL